MIKTRQILLPLVISLFIAAIGLTTIVLAHNTESRAKSEWACLQSAEYEWRERLVASYPLLQERHGYRIACVPPTDGQKKIWILLTPKSEPRYKQMPSKADYKLTDADLNTIVG